MLEKIENKTVKIAVIGLGYVGLPLAVEFGKKFDTVGFDIKADRLSMLSKGIDITLETSSNELKSANLLQFTNDVQALKDCDIFIVTVPTPVDKYNRPDLTPLYKSSETVGKVMKKGAIVIYESTVFPGCTEEECVPILERFSGLKFNQDFYCGYSPERINPGDKEHTLTKILKITSGSTPEVADIVDGLYNSILLNGTHKASCIKVAEAAKVIENSQRDLNIAFVNELAKIFRLIGIDTNEVLEAAGTKWNFLKFRPGLVGGHCIGVDPYYLTHKAQELGYMPEVILAGRRINDGMGKYIADEIIKLMIKQEQKIYGAKVLQLGITFKENCPDIRNSHAIDVTRALQDFGCQVDVYDPWADEEEIKNEYGVTSIREVEKLKLASYDAIILTVSHREFQSFDFEAYKKADGIIFDIKGLYAKDKVTSRL